MKQYKIRFIEFYKLEFVEGNNLCDFFTLSMWIVY